MAHCSMECIVYSRKTSDKLRQEASMVVPGILLHSSVGIAHTTTTPVYLLCLAVVLRSFSTVTRG